MNNPKIKSIIKNIFYIWQKIVMKKYLKIKVSKVLAFLFLALVPVLVSWGGWGHQRISRAAVFALPQPMLSFFYNHIDYITQESTVPDLRKYTLNDKSEGPRHFIDLENFGSLDSLPLTMEAAKVKYDEKFLQQNGILPWYLMDMMDKLTKAFKNQKKDEILFLAADLAHYVADAHMPFHCTSNYDGQLTDQKGIHALWETQIPESFGDMYNFYAGQATYIPDIQKEIWSIIKHSNSLVDTVLLADKQTRLEMNGNIYVLDDKGTPKKNKYGASIYSKDFTAKLNQKMNGMVEKQLKLSIIEVANFWYTAWVNAGKPDLSVLDPDYQTKNNQKMLKKELKLYNQGKLINIKTNAEFVK